MTAPNQAVPSRAAHGVPCAIDLCRTTPVVSTADTNGVVRDLFDRPRALTRLPVVDEGRPLGLIKRHTSQSKMAKPFRRELHERKTCREFMDATALIVEADTTIER